MTNKKETTQTPTTDAALDGINGLPADQTNPFAEAAKARAIAEGRYKEPKNFDGPSLAEAFAMQRPSEVEAEKARRKQEIAEPPSWVHTMALPESDPLRLATKQRIINGTE